MNKLLEDQLRVNCYGSPDCEPGEKCCCPEYYGKYPEEFEDRKHGRMLIARREGVITVTYYPNGDLMASNHYPLQEPAPHIWLTLTEYENFVLKLRSKYKGQANAPKTHQTSKQESLCGNPHNNAEDSCPECETVKANI